VWVDDEDEFAEHQVTLGYPEDVIVTAKASCTEVLAAVMARDEPFSGVHREWIARLRSGRPTARGL
jgi:protein associated with RNAse G/E